MFLLNRRLRLHVLSSVGGKVELTNQIALPHIVEIQLHTKNEKRRDNRIYESQDLLLNNMTKHLVCNVIGFITFLYFNL